MAQGLGIEITLGFKEVMLCTMHTTTASPWLENFKKMTPLDRLQTRTDMSAAFMPLIASPVSHDLPVYRAYCTLHSGGYEDSPLVVPVAT